MHCSLSVQDVNTQQQHKLMVGSLDMLSICTVAQQSHHEVSDKRSSTASMNFKCLTDVMCKHAGWCILYQSYLAFVSILHLCKHAGTVATVLSQQLM